MSIGNQHVLLGEGDGHLQLVNVYAMKEISYLKLLDHIF
jgi:hypothetical protein